MENSSSVFGEQKDFQATCDNTLIDKIEYDKEIKFQMHGSVQFSSKAGL